MDPDDARRLFLIRARKELRPFLMTIGDRRSDDALWVRNRPSASFTSFRRWDFRFRGAAI